MKQLNFNDEQIRALRHAAVDMDYDSPEDMVLESVFAKATQSAEEVKEVQTEEKDVADQFVHLLSIMSNDDITLARKILNDPRLLEQFGYEEPQEETEEEDLEEVLPELEPEIDEESIIEVEEVEEPEKKPAKKKDLGPKSNRPTVEERMDAMTESIDAQSEEIIANQENIGKEIVIPQTKSGYKGNKMFDNSYESKLDEVDQITDTEEDREIAQTVKDKEFNDGASRAIEHQLRHNGKYVKPQKGRVLNYDPNEAKKVKIKQGKYINAQRERPLTDEERVEKDMSIIMKNLNN